MLWRGLEKNGMVRAWHGHGMASVNQTRLYCVNQMGKTHSEPLAAWHGRRTAWARHGHGMLCVNRSLGCRTTEINTFSYTLLKLVKLHAALPPLQRVLKWNCVSVATNRPIPVAQRSKAWVCRRSYVGIMGSNPDENMSICL